METPLQKKRFKLTGGVALLFLLFLFLIPFVAIFIFLSAENFLMGRSDTEAFVLFMVIVAVIIMSSLIWYILYLRALMKTTIELNVEDKVRELLFSIEKFQKLFENAPIPYLILDEKGMIKDLNKAAMRFFHGTPENMITTNLFSYVTADNMVGVSLEKYYELRSPIEKRQVKVRTLQGEERWVEISFFAMQEAGKNYSGFVSLFDITDQKNLDQTKTEFISLASHQMRTPLATNKWYSEMLLSSNFGEMNAKQKEYVQTMHEVTENMIDLVDTLLNISRLEIGKITVDVETTNVQELADNILVELTSQINKRGMNIVKQYNNLHTSVQTDPKLLRIILHNLLTNAIKYTPEKGTITLSFGQKDGKNTVTVSDTGYGIPANQQSKIFTKLFRADNVKDKSSSQSTGLGLYLIKSLVEAIGGKIGFQSVENKGTSFTVEF